MKNTKSNKSHFYNRSSQKFGFTIIELVAVITVMGILTGISIISYSNWRQSILVSQLKSDLSGAVSAMENARNFGTGYPTSIPSSFTPSSNVSVNGGSTDGKTYCIYAYNTQYSSIIYRLDSTDSQNAKSGICP